MWISFGRFNPIYAQGGGGTVITGVHNFSGEIAFAALAQLDIQPVDPFKIG